MQFEKGNWTFVTNLYSKLSGINTGGRITRARAKPGCLRHNPARGTVNRGHGV